MSRADRKKNDKSKENNKIGRKLFCISILLFLLIFGIKTVDDAFRSMLLIDEPKVFGHLRLDESVHQIYFLGEKVFVNEEDIREVYGYMTNEVEVFIQMIRDKKGQLVKRSE